MEEGKGSPKGSVLCTLCSTILFPCLYLFLEGEREGEVVCVGWEAGVGGKLLGRHRIFFFKY